MRYCGCVIAMLGPCLLLPLMAAAAGAPGISGTWVAPRSSPLGPSEVVYRFKVDASGRISGFLTSFFGDSVIRDGRVVGNEVDLTLDMNFFGRPEQREIKGQLIGDELRFDGASIMPPGPRPGASAAPSTDAAGAERAAAFQALRSQPLVFHRGEPAPSYRAEPLDYKTVAPIKLPVPETLPANGLAQTPPMGWNSWNKFQTHIDDKTVRAIADALVSSGMRDAGYVYVNIDDGWQGKRDAAGVLQPNPNFPDMKALAAYVHSKGLKLGIYSSPGPRSCAGFEGSYGHEELDARTWGEWGINYLKYDWCSAGRIWRESDMRAAYQKMGAALAATGRPMVYSLCQYGRADVQQWGPLVSGNLWRTTGDISDRWSSMLQNVAAQEGLAASAGPGHWNDPDMLEIGNGGMTAAEYRTHFSLWAIAAAPLIAGNDVRTMDADTREILLNKEVIAVDQEPLGRQGRRVAQNGATDIWLRSLANGAYALALVNRGNADADVVASWSELQLPDKLHARDLWRHADLGILSRGYTARVAAHGVVMLRLTP